MTVRQAWLAAVVVLFSCRASAQWRAVDGGFTSPPQLQTQVRTLEFFAPNQGDGWYVVTDSGSAKTALRFRFTTSPPYPASLDDAGTTLRWSQRTLRASGEFAVQQQSIIEFQVAPDRVWTRLEAAPGQYRAVIRGPMRLELEVSGACTDGPAALTLDCDSFALRVAQLDALDVKSPVGPLVAGADDGPVLMGEGELLEWQVDGGWARIGALPLPSWGSAAVTPSGDLVATGFSGEQTQANFATWVRRGTEWSGPFDARLGGKILRLEDGTLRLHGGTTLFSWADDHWAAEPWPRNIQVFDLTVGPDGGYWVETPASVLLYVSANGESVQLERHRFVAPLLSMRLRHPARLSSDGIEEGGAPDGGWWFVERFLGSPLQSRPIPLGTDGRGRVFIALNQPDRPPQTMLYDPWRDVGSRCAADWQCESRACVDGRCCSTRCPADRCGVCSVEKGATEDGVCTEPPAAECSTTPEPEAPKGCGCSSAEMLATFALVWLARRRRAPVASGDFMMRREGL